MNYVFPHVCSLLLDKSVNTDPKCVNYRLNKIKADLNHFLFYVHLFIFTTDLKGLSRNASGVALSEIIFFYKSNGT